MLCNFGHGQVSEVHPDSWAPGHLAAFPEGAIAMTATLSLSFALARLFAGLVRSAKRWSFERQAAAGPLEDCLPRPLSLQTIAVSQAPSARSGLLAPQQDKTAVERNREDLTILGSEDPVLDEKLIPSGNAGAHDRPCPRRDTASETEARGHGVIAYGREADWKAAGASRPSGSQGPCKFPGGNSYSQHDVERSTHGCAGLLGHPTAYARGLRLTDSLATARNSQ